MAARQSSWNEKSQAGQGLLEYAIIVAFVAVVAIVTLALLGPEIGNVFSEVSANLESRQQVADGGSGAEPEEEPGATLSVRVLDQAGGGVASVTVHAFDADGEYLGLVRTTDGTGQALFPVENGGYRYRADYQTLSFWSDTVTWPAQSEAVIQTGQSVVVANVADSTGAAMANVQVQVFTEAGDYAGVSGLTDELGQANFSVAGGQHQFCVTFQSKDFCSEMVELPGPETVTITVDQQLFTIRVVDAAGKGIAGVVIDSFTAQKSYLNRLGQTEANGELVVRLSDGDYYFRASYQTQYFWSPAVSTPAQNNTEIETGQQSFKVVVISGPGNGLADVPVYAFTSGGAYIGLAAQTGADGVALFELAAGDYKFRADVQGKEYWSAIVSLSDGSVEIETGEQVLQVKVEDAAGEGIGGLDVYAYTAEGKYLGLTGRTDKEGLTSFELTAGNFKFRVDYQGKTFWSAVANPAMGLVSIKTGQRPFTVVVLDSRGRAVHSARVEVYTSAGDYIGLRVNTDKDGQAVFDLSDGDYFFLARKGWSSAWSPVVNSPGSLSVKIELLN